MRENEKATQPEKRWRDYEGQQRRQTHATVITINVS
jgi:hypothetical protein